MQAVNLLPPELRTAPRRRRRAQPAEAAIGGAGPLFVLGALALCVLALAGYVLAVNDVTERRSELARVTAEHEATSIRAAALKPYGDFQALAILRRETVSSLASLRFDWEQSLRDVSHAVPAGVTLLGLDGSISTDTGAGAGAVRGAIASPAITLKGCTVNQARVATMLSRLRGIRGVTRVSLARSERKPGAEAGGGGEVPPCGTGSVPEFEIVVFFERSVATAPGVTTTTAAATAVPSATGAPTPTPTPGAAQPSSGTPAPNATPTPSTTPAP